MINNNLIKKCKAPVFMDCKNDLAARPNGNVDMDSWYVKFDFQCEDKHVGFAWHQAIISAGEGKLCQSEILVMESTEKVWIDKAMFEPISENSFASGKELNLRSALGSLIGNHEKMVLKLELENAKIDVVLTVKDVLYNGGTGLFPLYGVVDSYEFAFPNMNVNGIIVIEGKEYHIQNSIGWFDRQWGNNFKMESLDAESNQTAKWMWIGLGLNDYDSEALSLWDAYIGDSRNTFVTILKENGSHVYAGANVTYDNIWTSKRSGNKYPAKIVISVPTIDLDLTLTAIFDNPEFTHTIKNAGSESFFAVEGLYQGKSINKYVIVEIVGNLCGD